MRTIRLGNPSPLIYPRYIEAGPDTALVAEDDGTLYLARYELVEDVEGDDLEDDESRLVLTEVARALVEVLPENAVTTISVSPASTATEAVEEIVACWRAQARPGAVPAWIETEDVGLLLLLVARTGWVDVPTKAPLDVEETHHTPAGPPESDDGTVWRGTPKKLATVPPGVAEGLRARPSTGGLPGMLMLLVVLALLLTRGVLALRTNAGRDHQSRVVFDTASNATGTYAASNWIALTENAGPPDATHTTLAGELTGEGLARAQATYSHTNGTNTVSLTKTFTMTSGTSRTPRMAGLFNAAAVGTLAYETAIPSPPTLVPPADQLGVAWTMTL